MKNMSKFLVSLLYVALGLGLIFKPDMVEDAVCYILAGCAVVIGVVKVIGYMASNVETRIANNTNGFAEGVSLIIVGAFIFLKGTMFIMLIPFILGFMITYKGVEGIQNILNLKKFGYDYSKPMFIMSLVVIGFGILVMYNPFATARMLFRIMGIGLVVSGAADLLADIVFTNKLKDGEAKAEKEAEEAAEKAAEKAEEIAE